MTYKAYRSEDGRLLGEVNLAGQLRRYRAECARTYDGHVRADDYLTERDCARLGIRSEDLVYFWEN